MQFSAYTLMMQPYCFCVERKKLWNSLLFCFFFLSFLALFLDGVAKCFCEYFITCYLENAWPGSDLFLEYTGKYFDDHLFIFTRGVLCALGKLLMTKLSEHVHVINVVHDVNLTL